MEIPTVYVLFYDFFYRCSVGDVKWKKACLEENDHTAPLSQPQAEAFAMMQLKNNYFAWLVDAKEKMVGLVTDYDTENKRSGMKSVAEVYLKKLEVNVEEKEEDDLLLVPETHGKYIYLKKKTDDMLKKQDWQRRTT